MPVEDAHGYARERLRVDVRVVVTGNLQAIGTQNLLRGPKKHAGLAHGVSTRHEVPRSRFEADDTLHLTNWHVCHTDVTGGHTKKGDLAWRCVTLWSLRGPASLQVERRWCAHIRQVNSNPKMS